MMVDSNCLNRIHHLHHHHYHEQGRPATMAKGTSRSTLAKLSLHYTKTMRNGSAPAAAVESMRERQHHSLITKTRISSASPPASSSATSSSPRRALITISKRARRSVAGGGGGRVAFIAMAAVALTMVSLVLLLTLTREAQALNCYTCSSADNPACDETFASRANFTETDCEKQIGRPAKVCRKIVQYIEDKKVVIRSCGWIDERADDKKNEKKPMCYKRSGTFALMMESCVCYEDNCNHSASLVPNQSVLTLLTACSSVYLYLAKRLVSS